MAKEVLSLKKLQEDVNSKFDAISAVLLELQQRPVAPAVETALDKEIKKAAPDEYMPVKREWEEKAREIIGEAMERCSMFYPKTGGVVFEVYIKPEFSNAPKDYLAHYKVDKRSKDIGNEGINGIEQYCKLIAQNLARKTTNN